MGNSYAQADNRAIKKASSTKEVVLPKEEVYIEEYKPTDKVYSFREKNTRNSKNIDNQKDIKSFLSESWYHLSSNKPGNDEIDFNKSRFAPCSGKIMKFEEKNDENFKQINSGQYPFSFDCIKMDGFKLRRGIPPDEDPNKYSETIFGFAEILDSREFKLKIDSQDPKVFQLLFYNGKYAVVSSVDRSVSWIAVRPDFLGESKMYYEIYKKWKNELALNNNYSDTAYEIFSNIEQYEPDIIISKPIIKKTVVINNSNKFYYD